MGGEGSTPASEGGGQERIYSRVTVVDAATLYVTESRGDFPSTVLEEIVSEHIPAYTHNPPTLVLLESNFNHGDRDLELTEPTPLAAALVAILRKHVGREP